MVAIGDNFGQVIAETTSAITWLNHGMV